MKFPEQALSMEQEPIIRKGIGWIQFLEEQSELTIRLVKVCLLQLQKCY